MVRARQHARWFLWLLSLCVLLSGCVIFPTDPLDTGNGNGDGTDDGSGSSNGDADGNGGGDGSSCATLTDLLPNSYLEEMVLECRLMRWTHSPVRVLLDTTNTPMGYKNLYEQQMEDALQQWQDASVGALSFVRVVESAEITVRWVDSIEAGDLVVTGLTTVEWMDSPEGACFFPPLVEIALSANGQPVTDEEIDATAIHEFGHALGLSGHSPVESDVMYAASIATALTARDIATFRDLYSRPAGVPECTTASANTRGPRKVIRMYRSANRPAWLCRP